MIEGGVRPATADEIMEVLESGNDIDDYIYWYSKQQRQAAFLQKRKRDGIDTLNSILDELGEPEKGADGWMSIKAVYAILGRHDGRIQGVKNVEATQRWYQGRYHKKMMDMINRFRSKPSLRVRDLFLSQDVEGQALFVRAVYGEKVGDPDIEELARMWLELVEEMRVDFNNAGGWIDKLEDWKLPQAWDSVRVRERFKTPEEWIEYMKPKLDTSRMKARDLGPTGKKKRGKAEMKYQTTDRPMTDAEVDEALTYVWETIRDNGHNKLDPMEAHHGRAGLNNKYNHERILHIASAEDWLTVQKEIGQLGNATIFDHLMSHVDKMAGDTATLEVLPPAAFESVLAQAKKRAGRLPDTAEEQARWMYADVAGRLAAGTAEGAAAVLQEGKNIVTAGKLGSAVLPALADTGFLVPTAALNGVSPMKALGAVMGSLFDDGFTKQMAMQVGLGGDLYIKTSHAHARFGDSVLVGKTGGVAEGVLRYSGLMPWTHSVRSTFQLEHLAELGRHIGKDLDDLPHAIRGSFERYGIGEAEWRAIQKQGTTEAGYIDVSTEAGKPFHRLVTTEVGYASPTPDAASRRFLHAGQAVNSVQGQLVRSLTNLKSFPIHVMSSHWNRIMHDRIMQPMDKVQYAGYLMAHTAMIGTMVVVAKDLLVGKELPDFEDEKVVARLFGRGILTGGSLGLAGDILLGDPYAYGDQGIGDRLLGAPLGGVLNDVTALMPYKYLTSEDYDGSDYAADAVKAIARNAPSVWWARPATTAMKHALIESLNPEGYRDMQSRTESREQDQYGRDLWLDMR